MRILTRAEKKKIIGKKVAKIFNDQVDAKIRNPKPKIDEGFKEFKPRGPGRLKPPTGEKTSDYD